jgi:hypothetical protein
MNPWSLRSLVVWCGTKEKDGRDRRMERRTDGLKEGEVIWKREKEKCWEGGAGRCGGSKCEGKRRDHRTERRSDGKREG